MKKEHKVLAIIEFILAILLIVVSVSLTVWKGIYINHTQVTNFTKITFGVQLGLIPFFAILEYVAFKDFSKFIKQKNKNKKQPKK